MPGSTLAIALGLPADSLRRPRRVGFEEVVRAWAAARDPSQGSGPWTRRMLDAADAQFGGHWLDMQIRADALLHLVLPRHAGEPCHGDRRELVPSGGLPLGVAATRLREWDKAARAESRECWKRVTIAMDEPFSRLVLATAPLLGHPDYDGLPPGPGLFHLDGWHRLVGWAMADRLTDVHWVGVHLAGTASVPRPARIGA